ncbi:MAG: HD-GYP domain-containing protein [Gemmatimonadota bacterium]
MSASRIQPIHALVAFVGALTAATAFGAWRLGGDAPGLWELVAFFIVTVLLEQMATQFRPGAYGSTSFTIHLAAGVLFGPFWGGTLTALSAVPAQLARRASPTKLIYNVSQLSLAVSLAFLVYSHLGGSVPPRITADAFNANPNAARQDVGLFFLAAAVYFVINSLAVSAALAVAGGRSFGRVWLENSRGVFLYDLGASTVALLVSWLFLEGQNAPGLLRWGFLAMVVPIIVVRHIYQMNRKLQDAYEKLEEAYEQLEEKVREQLQMMVKAIEAHDPYTSGHSARVSTLSGAIARELGLSEEETASIETAALLHDVGKAHAEFVPLLRKEGKLTSDEWALLQQHPTRSAAMVSMASSFRGYIEQAVRHHHERWDGAGYPDGIAGEQIPIGARIIMIADTIDAMMTDRPYRKALGLDVVIAELQKHSGSQFDPSLVDLVVNSVGIRRLLSGPVPSTQLLASARPRHGGSTKVRPSYFATAGN